MRKLNTIAALLAGAAALMATPALAQRNLDREDNDYKAFTDTFASDGEPRSFTFSVPAGQRLTIDVMARDGGDPVITLVDLRTDTQVATDDDGGSELNSRIDLVVGEATRYRLDVEDLGGEPNAGAFDLTLRTSRYEPPRTVALTLGDTQQLDLTADRPSLFTFAGREGQMIEITMQSEGLDPMLMLYRGATAEGELVSENDDGPDGLNSRIVLRLPQTGTYAIRASDYEDRAGAYSLSLREIEFVEVGGPLALDTQMAGDLMFAAEDESGLSGAFAEYTLAPETITALANASGWLIIDMTSDAIDPLLEAGFSTPLGFAAAQSDDDSGGGLNARLLLELSQIDPAWLQSLRLRARSADGEAGAYTMMVRHDPDGTLMEELEMESRQLSSETVMVRPMPPAAERLDVTSVEAMEDAADAVEGPSRQFPRPAE